MEEEKVQRQGKVTVIGTGRGPRNSGPPSLTSPDRRSRDSLPVRLFFQCGSTAFRFRKRHRSCLHLPAQPYLHDKTSPPHPEFCAASPDLNCQYLDLEHNYFNFAQVKFYSCRDRGFVVTMSQDTGLFSIKRPREV